VAFLIGLGLTAVLSALGVHRRWREVFEVDADYLSKLAWRSVGLGMATGSLVLPALWMLVSYSIFGGSIESNLPPGTTPGFLLTLLLVGALMTLVYTFVGYRDHVYPYRVVEGRFNDWDAEPLARGPDDSPE
jgi:hypothetical protein